MSKPNRAQRVIAFLESRYPGWVPAVELEPIGGRQAWRTAVSEARAIVKAHGDDIEWRGRAVFHHELGCAADRSESFISSACVCNDGQRWTLSEYRLKKAVESQPVSTPRQGHDDNVWSLRP